MTYNKISKISQKFICENCNYNCSKYSEYNKHLLTAKHKILTNTDAKISNKCKSVFNCECGKLYKHRQSLYNHKNKCSFVNNDAIPNNKELSTDHVHTDLITKLLMQNQDLILSNQQFKELIVDQQHENQKLQNKLIEAVKDSGSTINNNHNTTNNNQKFNLNFFLNTTCKDALNMSDFIENMEIGFKDIENIGKNGYVSGMTDMILSRIKELDVTKRPLHCTDLKRETMYIKDNDEWSKDTPDNSKLHKTIKYVAKRNYTTIPLWREKHPECQDWNNPQYDFCVDMMRNILGDVGDEQIRLDNKVIKNLSKHILVDKN